MSVMAPIAEPPELKRFSGAQRAAALMLALGKDHGAPIWEQLSTDEVKELSSTIAGLGRIPAQVVEHLLVQFTSEVASMATLHGSYETTERLLTGILPGDKVKEIMEDIRGPSGRTMWDKLSNVSESVLAGALKHEYPQTVAVILSKLRPDHAARVLSELPRDFSVDVIMRMLRMETVQKDVINQVEQTLKTEFMTNLSRSQKRDPHEAMAELFNSLDRSTEEAMLTALDNRAPESAERIRALMFTFEDLGNLLPPAISSIVRNADKRQMALALKGAPDSLKQLFFGAMTERASKLLREDMAGMGPVRARDCEEAQSALVRLAKDLADRGEILLVDPKSDDAMIIQGTLPMSMHAHVHVERFGFDRIFAVPPGRSAPIGPDAALEVATLRAELALLKSEQESALALARAQGYETGLAQARAEREVALLSAVDALQAGIEVIDAQFTEVSERVTGEAAEIALAAADMIAGRALETAPGAAIDEAIGRALSQVARGTELLVRVHPDLLEDIEGRIADRQSRDRRKLNLIVVPDADIPVGDARIGWEEGGLALDAAARREAVLTELETLLKAA